MQDSAEVEAKSVKGTHYGDPYTEVPLLILSTAFPFLGSYLSNFKGVL